MWIRDKVNLLTVKSDSNSLPIKRDHLLYLGLCLIVCRFAAAYCFSTFDDAFITYRYAVNVTNGLGFYYNPPERVLGTTAPLFALICSLPALLHLNIPKSILYFNIIVDLSILYVVCTKIFSRNKTLSLIFGLLFAIDPTTNRIAIGGMEANLFLLMSLLAISFFTGNRKSLSYTLLSFSYFLRPEAIILLSVLLVHDCTAERRIPFKQIALSATILAIPLLVMYQVYGHFLPQSVIAKNQLGINPFSSLVKSVLFPNPFSWVIFPLAIAGGYLIIVRRSALRLIVFWIMIYALAYLIRGPWVMNWYIFPIAVGELIMASVFIEKLSVRITPRIRFPEIAVTIVPAVVWLLVAVLMGRSRTETKIFSALKRDFGKDITHSNKSFFAEDIGALGFYTGGYIYDNLLLVSPQLATYPSARERITIFKPDYLFVYTTRDYLEFISSDPVISREYVFVKRYSKTGEITLPKSREITNGYNQDFLLFKKRNCLTCISGRE